MRTLLINLALKHLHHSQAANTFLETVAKVGPACGIEIRGGNILEIRSDRYLEFKLPQNGRVGHT